MGSYVVRRRMILMWGGGVRLQGILHMPGLPGLLLQCTRSLSGLNVACVYAHACELVHLLLMWCFCFLSMIAMYYARLMLSPDV